MVLQQYDIIYLTKYYTPTSAAAGIRADRQIKSLIQNNLRVVVVTGGEKAQLETSSQGLVICRIDPAGRLPDELRHAKIAPWPWSDPLPGPDHNCSFVKAAYCAAQPLIRQYRPTLIYATGTPFPLLAVADQLGQKFQLPVVQEFRDCWYHDMNWPYASWLRRRQARRWEDRCIRNAKTIVTGTEGIKASIDRRFGPEIAQKTVAITHSYDPDDVGYGVPGDQTRNKDTLTIVYTGQLRGLDLVDRPFGQRVLKNMSKQLRRVLLGSSFCEQLRLDWMSPHYLMRAIAQLARENPAFAQKVRLVFVGQKFPQIDTWARQLNLTGNVEQLGQVPTEKARQITKEADLLIYYLYGIKNLDYHWCVPSKLYTYLGAGKAILAPIPSGEAKDLIIDAGTGFFAEPDSVPSIAGQLDIIFKMHQNGGIKIQPNWDMIRQYELPIQQHQYAQTILSLLNKHQTPTELNLLCVE